MLPSMTVISEFFGTFGALIVCLWLDRLEEPARRFRHMEVRLKEPNRNPHLE